MSWVFYLLGGFLIAVVVLRSFLNVVNVVGVSMQPALQHGDRLLALRHWPARKIRRGQIVIIYVWWCEKGGVHENELLVKRVTGIPGDRARVGDQEICVPEGHFFVESDFEGADSRRWGPVPDQRLYGISLFKLRHSADR